MKTPESVAAKWQNAVAGAGTAYTNGVNGVTVSPTQLAAAQQDKWARRVQEAAAQNRFANKLNAVTLQDWKNAAVSKGASRLTSGAQAAKPKVQAFMTAFLPVMDNVSQQVKSMPKNNLEDSLARVRVQMEAAKRFAGRM